MRGIITSALVAIGLIVSTAAPAPAHNYRLPIYTYAYHGSVECTMRMIYGQYGNNAFAEMQQVAEPGSRCSAWSGLTLTYHDGANVRHVFCSILGKIGSPGSYPNCTLLGPGLGIRAVHAGALLEGRPNVCFWYTNPGQVYPPCFEHVNTVF